MMHDAEVPRCDILQQAFLKLLRIFHQIPDQARIANTFTQMNR